MTLLQRISRVTALLRYHQPRQFAWRLYRTTQRHIRRRLPSALAFRTGKNQCRWKPEAAVAFRDISERRKGLWPERTKHAAEMAEGTFCFLNETKTLALRNPEGGVSIDWNPDAPRLWRFHLQCQESLLELAEAKGADAAYAVIESWLSEPRHLSPTSDPDAWHPFCLSRRLPVWLALASSHEPPATLSTRFWQSIADQVSWLSKNCEWDLGGNHLIENLTALYLADAFLLFDRPVDMGFVTDCLRRQFREQILPSGEHYERTPTYHALMQVCLLHCIQASEFLDDELKSEFIAVADRMFQFADWIRQPHAAFALLSDSVLSETPEFGRLRSWTEAWVGSETHGESEMIEGSESSDQTAALERDFSLDYWAHENGAGSRILFDVGPLACDHLPAHGHADLLQVVASLGGIDAIVDSGNYQYAPGERRTRCRSTAAHNVLQIGSDEQCDLWSSFRMGRRGHPVWTRRDSVGETQWCAAAHDGFGFPVGRVVIATPQSWTILDWFYGRKESGRAVSRLHLHPNWQLEHGLSSAVVNLEQRSCREPLRYRFNCLGESPEVKIVDTEYYPNFGEAYPNQTIECSEKFDAGGWLGFHLPLDSEQPNDPPRVVQNESRISATFPDQAPLVWEL